MEVLAAVWDRILGPIRWIRGLLAGRLAADEARTERSRQVLRDISTAMIEVLSDGDKIGRYTVDEKYRAAAKRAELRVASLATEVADDELRRRLASFSQLAIPIIERRAASRDAALNALREGYDSALERIAELQRDLR